MMHFSFLHKHLCQLKKIIEQLKEIEWEPQLIVSDVFLADENAVQRNSEFVEGTIGTEFSADLENPKFQKIVKK